jgi:hypothetical protein
MSAESPTYFQQAPLLDSYSVVLTAPLSSTDSELIIDVAPAPTRTYDSDQAFNPDLAFGRT